MNQFTNIDDLIDNKKPEWDSPRSHGRRLSRKNKTDVSHVNYTSQIWILFKCVQKNKTNKGSEATHHHVEGENFNKEEL